MGEVALLELTWPPSEFEPLKLHRVGAQVVEALATELGHPTSRQTVVGVQGREHASLVEAVAQSSCRGEGSLKPSQEICRSVLGHVIDVRLANGLRGAINAGLRRREAD